MTDFKPAVRSEADVEALVIAAIRRLGRGATSNEIWRLVDAAFDVSFETRRNIFDRLTFSGHVAVEEHRDNRMPEPVIRIYRLGTFATTGRNQS